jgi:hypothetical protein
MIFTNDNRVWKHAPSGERHPAKYVVGLTNVGPIGVERNDHMADEDEKPVRLTINLSPQTHADLTRRAKRDGVTLTDYIRRCVTLKGYVEDKKITTLKDDSEREYLVLG